MPRVHIPDPNANYTLPEETTVRKTIGQKVKELRLKHRMSQIELAKNLGKESATYLALIEQGKRSISAAALARLATHLKVKLSYFYP